jgi:hypothetical protein
LHSIKPARIVAQSVHDVQKAENLLEVQDQFPKKSPAMRVFSCSVPAEIRGDQFTVGSLGVTGAEGGRGPRAKRVASILRRSSTPCPLPVTLSTA